MSQVRAGTRRATRPLPDEVALPEQPSGRAAAIWRAVGGIALLVVGVVHLYEYVADHYDSVPVIGPLFALNFAGATLMGLGLLLPWARLRALHLLLALGGIGLAATSFVFLFVSEHQPLFGFQEDGYRAAIVLALVAEAVAVVALVGYLATRGRRRS